MHRHNQLKNQFEPEGLDLAGAFFRTDLGQGKLKNRCP